MVIFTTGYCYDNSLQYTYMNEKETPGPLPIFTANAGDLSPTVKQIDSSFLVLHIFTGENTINAIESHLKLKPNCKHKPTNGVLRAQSKYEVGKYIIYWGGKMCGENM